MLQSSPVERGIMLKVSEGWMQVLVRLCYVSPTHAAETFLCDSTGGAQVLPVHVAKSLCSALIASICVMAGIPELVDLAFNLTAGHIDTHVLMTLAVFGTLAIGSALEVSASLSPGYLA